MFKQHEKLIENIAYFYGINGITLQDVCSIGDDLFCLRSHNATLPKWYTEEAASELDLITDKIYQVSVFLV